jgi:hypothetical protein
MRVLFGAAVLAFGATSHATNLSIFGGSDTNGAARNNVAVTINLTFNKQTGGVNDTGQLSTATGYQYNSAYSDGSCPGSGSCFFNQGWWSMGTGQTTFDENPNSNYLAGDFGAASYRDFFSFDTKNLNAADVSSGILSAQFVVTLFDESGAGSVQFVLSQTTLSSATFNDTVGTNAVNKPAVYADLGNGLLNPGMQVGSTFLVINGGSYPTTQLGINLNSAGLAQIIAAFNNNGTAPDAHVFTFGGALVPQGAPVPEPATALLVATGALGVLRRWRK